MFAASASLLLPVAISLWYTAVTCHIFLAPPSVLSAIFPHAISLLTLSNWSTAIFSAFLSISTSAIVLRPISSAARLATQFTQNCTSLFLPSIHSLTQNHSISMFLLPFERPFMPCSITASLSLPYSSVHFKSIHSPFPSKSSYPKLHPPIPPSSTTLHFSYSATHPF